MRPALIPWRALLRAGGLALGVGLPVAALAYVVRSDVSPIVRWDQHAIVETTDFTRSHPAFHDALIVWQEISQPRWVYLAGSLVCVWVWRRHHQPGRALWGFGTMVAAWLIANFSKEIVRRARPVVEDALVHAGGTSFPSGHAFASAAAGTTITLLLWPMLGPRGRVAVPTVAALFTLATGADRILLGAHYPSDVVGGILLGATVSGASYIGYRGWTALHDHTPDPEV
ncbi:phosphatase PAP2 family protein [Cellulomonas sp. PhB150]|uniref:phosphatase PAP2 family protein n=1 Tax=Cellulomonas sp. PhB150 TaxID=2485188 RepID=UPI000F4978CE|nr:phosphatase PAP2 family protein [Cellulomonas sp. PhB150]ROS23661.1 undecaprenyl-diphosphatase [Cellulomonas sp. PhB150]